MRRLITALFLFFTCVASAQEFPVLLRLTYVAQQDTTGCNFVKELTTLARTEVMAGRVALWDSPQKELRITPSSLDAISRAAGIEMGRDSSQLIYIYEYWEEQRGFIKSRTEGFLFSAKDPSGKEVSFGYIEYTALETACMRHKINTSVNGDYNATAALYLSSKNYNFSLIQFAGKVVTGIEESEALLSLFRKGRAFNVQHGNPPVQLKLVRLMVNAGPDADTEGLMLSQHFIAVLDSFLHDNVEFLYNNTPDSLHGLFQQKKWNVTRIEITEIWRKDPGMVSHSLVSMNLFINDQPLPDFPYRMLNGLELKVFGQPFIDWLARHEFSVRLLTINGMPLGRAEAVLYHKALLNAAWNRLSDYVKYY